MTPTFIIMVIVMFMVLLPIEVTVHRRKVSGARAAPRESRF
jgi:hypothetical protein